MTPASHGPAVSSVRRSDVRTMPAKSSGAEPQHADLVEQPQAQHHTERRPPAERAPFDDLQERVRAERPEEDVERVHRIEVVERQEHGRHERGGHRQHQRPRPAAKLARHHPDQRNGGSAGERRHQPDRKQRIAEHGAHRPQDENAERRMVDVAGREAIGAREVIELVAEVAVALDRGKLHGELRQGEESDQRARRHGRTLNGVWTETADRSRLGTAKRKGGRRWRRPRQLLSTRSPSRLLETFKI